MSLDKLFLDNLSPEINLDIWKPLLSEKVKIVRMVPEKCYFVDQLVSNII